MVLAYVYAPIVIGGFGQIKFGKSFTVTSKGSVRVT